MTRPTSTALQFCRLGWRHRFDAVLVNSGNSRPRIAWNARFVRAGLRIGIATSRCWVDVSFPMQKGRSVAANNLQLLKTLIPEWVDQTGAEAFEVFWSQAERIRAEEFRRSLAENDRPLVGLVTQTSGGQPSQWWDERFVAVARGLQDRTGARLVFFGTKAEATRIEGIRRELAAGSISLAGETDLTDLAAHCAVCDLLVSLDTGTMHVGRAVGVPMVVVAPAWQPAWEWLPLGQERFKVVRRWDIGCQHCRKFHCATHECMDEISAAEVVEAALAQLHRFPPEAASRQRRLDAWTTGRNAPKKG